MRLLKMSNDLRQVLGSRISDITGDKYYCFTSNQIDTWCRVCKLKRFCHISRDTYYLAPTFYCMISNNIDYLICSDFNLRYTI